MSYLTLAQRVKKQALILGYKVAGFVAIPDSLDTIKEVTLAAENCNEFIAGIVDAIIKMLPPEPLLYDESNQFDSDYSRVQIHIESIENIVLSPRWLAWLHATDKNFNTNSLKINSNIDDSINSLKFQVNGLINDMLVGAHDGK
jgi:hypothetical protein